MQQHGQHLEDLLSCVEDKLGIAPSEVDAGAIYDAGCGLSLLYMSTLEPNDPNIL